MHRIALTLVLLLPFAGCAPRGVIVHGHVPTRTAEDTVVWLDRAPAGLAPPITTPVHVLQGVGGFSPRVISVPAGGVVEFENADSLWHNVFSVSPSRRFDLGKYGPGETRTIRFERAGVVRLFCELHPDDQAWVVVTPHAFTVRPDSSGTFTLPALPPGTYVVRAWSPHRGERVRRVRVDGAPPTLVF